MKRQEIIKEKGITPVPNTHLFRLHQPIIGQDKNNALIMKKKKNLECEKNPAKCKRKWYYHFTTTFQGFADDEQRRNNYR